MLDSGEGTTSGAADQARPVVTWEIAPLRAAALRTERAVNERWQTLRAAIIGSALLLGVIGSAAALSLTGASSVPGGMGFLSASSVESASAGAEHDVTASEARDGVADQGAPQPTNEPAPPTEQAPADSTPADAAPADSAPVTQPEAPRGTPSAVPQPQPEPTGALVPAPSPTPTAQPSAAAADDGGLLGGLLDLLLPGLLP